MAAVPAQVGPIVHVGVQVTHGIVAENTKELGVTLVQCNIVETKPSGRGGSRETCGSPTNDGYPGGGSLQVSRLGKGMDQVNCTDLLGVHIDLEVEAAENVQVVWLDTEELLNLTSGQLVLQ